MAKYPLIHFKGALFHITARGNDKRKIFLDDPRDFDKYIRNLDLCKKKFPYKIYAFALMPNHLHLLIEVNKYSIDKIMQVLQTGYTMYFNRKYNHVGHLFQGRYKSFLVDKESYLLELVRYIHLNPVRAGIVSDPIEYKWTSHIAYLDAKHKFNKIIDRSYILANLSGNRQKQEKIYQEFILSGITLGWDELFPLPAWGQIIGKEKFVTSIERKIRKIRK